MLRWVRLAVGTRSGYPPPDLERYGDRVVAFELDSPPVSSSEVRERVAAASRSTSSSRRPSRSAIDRARPLPRLH